MRPRPPGPSSYDNGSSHDELTLAVRQIRSPRNREHALVPRLNHLWSWGESNPRPTLSLHAFSGRSLWMRSARLRPLSQTPKSTSPASEESRVTSRPRHAARSRNDAGVRTGITCGPTDYRPASSGEGEVVALCIGNYCFAGSVHKITLHPWPASRGFTSAVETDQPRGLLAKRTVVTLWNCQRMRNIRALQDTTDAAPTPFPHGDAPNALTLAGRERSR